MIQCDSCRGLGVVPAASAFGMPAPCFKCSGSGQIALKQLHAPDHACHFYTDEHQQMQTMVSFIVEGLKKNERCVCVVHESSSEELRVAFSENGIQVADETARGSLLILTPQDAYLKNGPFVAKDILGQYRQFVGETLSQGFSALRACGEWRWILEDPALFDELLQYESLADDYFLNEKPRFLGLCQYNASHFPPAVIQGLRDAHRLVLQD